MQSPVFTSSIKDQSNHPDFSDDVSQGWNLNPENEAIDIILSYKGTEQEQDKDKDYLERSQKSQSKFNLLGQISSPSVSNKSPMMLSRNTFKLESEFDCLSVYKVQSQTESILAKQDKIKCFKKFKTITTLPETITQAEIRMKNRYYNKLRKDYLQKLDDQQLIEKKLEFVKAKSRINQMSMQKYERKRVYTIKANEIYQIKSETIQPPLRSLSLPLIKSKVINLVSITKPVQKQRMQTEIVPLSILNTTDAPKARTNIILTKHSRCHQKKSKQVCNNEDQSMQEVEKQLRRKGIPFQISHLKNALLQSDKKQSLSSFPSKNLISNPIIKKWGI